MEETALYTPILNGIKQSNPNLRHEDDLKQYLKDLRPYAKKLWQFYRSSSTTVEADYTNPNIQAAYLLRYYPHYARVTYTALKDLADRGVTLPFDSSELHVCFFGAGPGPELTGLVVYLKNYFPNIKNVTASIFDINTEIWSTSQKITRDYIIPSCSPELNLTLGCYNFDLSEKNSFYQTCHQVEKSNLCIIQNCLNKISNYNELADNITLFVREIPLVKSIFLISNFKEFSNYSYNLMKKIEDDLGQRNQIEVVHSLREQDIEFRSKNPPQIITQHLLTGEDGLKPKRNVKFNYLAFRKSLVIRDLNKLIEEEITDFGNRFTYPRKVEPIIFETSKTLTGHSNAIYIDSIFLYEALGKTCGIFRQMYPSRFSETEWHKRANQLNLADFLPHAADWSQIEGEIDVFLFTSKEYWGGRSPIQAKTGILEYGNIRFYIKIVDVDFVAYSLNMQVEASVYKKVVLVGDDRMYDHTLAHLIQQGKQVILLRLNNNETRMIARVNWQNISYPMGMTIGFKSDEL